LRPSLDNAHHINIASTMASSLAEYIQSLPVTDVHEHHLPELFLQPEVGLRELLQQRYAGWAQARPYVLPGETPR